MPAVVRIKRHRNEPRQDAFVLNCKRRRTDDEEPATAPAETSTVLTFAGTVQQDSDIKEEVAKLMLTKDEAKAIVQNRNRPQPNLTVRSRIEQNRAKSQQNRFKIVNCSRGQEEDASETSGDMTIVDVEKDNQEPQTGMTQASSSSYTDLSDDHYVYDIYIGDSAPSNLHQNDIIDLNDLSICEYEDYFYSSSRLVNSDSESDPDRDDEDSNDENNYKNDYPDEEDDMSDVDSIGEKEMRRAMNNLDADNISFEDDLDYQDGSRVGEAYARYRKRILRDLERSDNSNCDLEDEYDDENDELQNICTTDQLCTTD